MDLVRRTQLAVCALSMVLAAQSGWACDMDRWQSHIDEASRKYDVPETWIRAVIRSESAGCTSKDGHPIRSSVGAMGLMQLMPATWDELRLRHGLGQNPDDPRDNVLAGAAYLRELADRFGVPGAFAAYNAGPARYEEHLLLGRPLPPETRHYLVQVSTAAGMTESTSVATHTDSSPADSLFAVNGAVSVVSPSRVSKLRDARLFVSLRHGRDRQPGSEAADVQE